MDYIIALPLELLDEIACDELTYRGLLSVPQFARSITLGRRFDFMVKFGYDFHVKSGGFYWYNKFTKNGQYHRVNGPAKETFDGDKYWYMNGIHHRSDGPAKEHASGSKFWCINGQSHRVNGPSDEYANGNKRWYVNGRLHRLDGPAIEYVSGSKIWYINGKNYTEKEYNKIINDI